MERLTIPDVKLDKNTISRSIIDAEKVKECAMEIYWRLKALEDAVADEESEEYDLDRLRELVEADKDGRCVVLDNLTVADLQQMLTVLDCTRYGDGAETYTTGYRNGHRNGRIEILRHVLGINEGDSAEAEAALRRAQE